MDSKTEDLERSNDYAVTLHEDLHTDTKAEKQTTDKEKKKLQKPASSKVASTAKQPNQKTNSKVSEKTNAANVTKSKQKKTSTTLAKKPPTKDIMRSVNGGPAHLPCPSKESDREVEIRLLQVECDELRTRLGCLKDGLMGQKPSDVEHLLKQSQKELLWLQRQLSFISNGGPPCILSTNKIEEQTRRFWVHPINELRDSRGHIGQLYHELRRYPEKFYNFVRMPMEAFDKLQELLSTQLRRQDTRLRQAINPTERLLITLRFLATGESYSSLHLQFRVGKSTVSGIVRSTCHVIWQHLQPISMPSPTQETWLQAAAGFQSVAQFPNCIGAVDGKHVRVQQPPRSGSQYYNYKKYFSVVLMAVADANYKYLAIDVGAYGSTGDSRVLSTSDFGQQVLRDQVTLPPPKPLPGTTHPVPFVMVSDEAFPLMNNLLRPYPQRGLNARKRVFNARLSRARRFVECTFGIMSSKWRIFTCAMQLDEATVDAVIKAACVLHNFVRDYETLDLDVDTHVALNDSPINWGLGRPSNSAVLVRETFADYFMSPEGAVSWQV